MYDNNQKEFYCWYNPNTGKCGEKYTWRQLLYSFYEEIIEPQKPKRVYNWKIRTYTVEEAKINPYHYMHMATLFGRIGHCDKDVYYVDPEPRGYWKTEWKWTLDPTVERYFEDENGNLVKGMMVLKPFKSYVYYPRVPRFKNRIIDSFGRVIPVGYLKTAYLTYVANSNDKKPIPIRKVLDASRWSLRSPNVVICGYKFRQGPVPGIHKWRKWKYPKVKHGGTSGELRRWYADKADQREVFEEFRATWKLKGSRNPTALSTWEWRDRHFIGKKGFGWKRTKKRKQWM